MNYPVALLLWLSTMVLILANSAIGDTIIASASPRVAEIYKSLVPLPYVALCAWVLARRSPNATMADALGGGLLWAASTVVADILLTRLLLDHSWRLASVHYRFWDGYWFVLVPLVQLLAPVVAIRLLRRAEGTRAAAPRV